MLTGQVRSVIHSVEEVSTAFYGTTIPWNGIGREFWWKWVS